MEYFNRRGQSDATMAQLQSNLAGTATHIDDKTKKVINETKKLMKIVKPDKHITDAQILETLARHVQNANPTGSGGSLIPDVHNWIGGVMNAGMPVLHTISELIHK